MPKRMILRERVRWVANLPIPDDYAFILALLCAEADDYGLMPFLWRKLESTTRFRRLDFDRAIQEFVAWGVMSPEGIDKRFSVPADRYRIHYGSEPALQLSLGVHAMLSRIEKLKDITDRQELALQKLVVRHYDWVTGLVTATTEEIVGSKDDPEELPGLSPRWSQQRTNEAIAALVDKGYLSRAPRKRRGYGSTPQAYVLNIIRTDSPEIRSIEGADSPEIRSIKGADSPEIRSIEAPHPYTDYSTDYSYDQTPAPAPAAAVQPERSNFWGRLMELDAQAAFALLPLEGLERHGPWLWHEEWADRALEDLEELLDKRGITDPPGAVIKRFRDRIEARWDMTRPPPRSLGDRGYGNRMLGRY